MGTSESQTAELLRRWHGGERAALDALLARDLDWIREHVKKRLGPGLRGHGETQDYVQDAVVQILSYGPRFVTADRERFRALLAQIVENTLRDRNDWFRAARRAASREQRLGSGTVLDLDQRGRTATRPSENVERLEREAWSRLALELLEPEDRDVIVARHWEGMSFAAMGEHLGVSEDAARMRFHRALPKLANKLVELRGTAPHEARNDP